MTSETRALAGAFPARQRVEEGPEALGISPVPNVAKQMRARRGLVVVQNGSIASISVAAAGDSHCRAPYPAPSPPVSENRRTHRTNRRDG